MQISSNPRVLPFSGAEAALRILTTPAVSTPHAPEPQTVKAGTSDIAGILAYAAKAKAFAAQAQTAPYDPADHLPPGYTMGDLVSVDTLEPEYRAFAQSSGATHVRLIRQDSVSDAELTQKISSFLDESYGHDRVYQAAKSAGHISIRRQSDVMTELGDTRAGDQSMAFFRGAGGSEHIGGGFTGITSPTFDAWWAAQNAAGRFVVPARADALRFVASWPA